MIYREVGKLPLQTFVDKQLIAYWLRILNKDVNTFSYMVYMIALNLFRRDEYKSQWLKELSIFWIVVAYPICGTISTKFLLNCVKSLSINE